jgi:twitching motility protein PilT
MEMSQPSPIPRSLRVSPQITPYLRAVVLNGGSDLHIKPLRPPRVRIGGSLVPLEVEAMSAATIDTLVRETMTADVAAHFDLHHEADYALVVPGVGRFRVNAFRARGEVGAVLRLIGESPTPLHELGMPDVVRRLALEARGLVLVTGPTGSGKSTTLAGMVDAVNESKPVHVLTLEDPIETIHEDKMASVTQREVGTDTGDWASALRAAMRQDPDVILIGEMRDAETVRSALSAAETGHLVLSTLHTRDAKETVGRIIEFFPAHEHQQIRHALASSLRGIVCQRLVTRADGGGRTAVMEIAVNTPRLAEAIANPERTELIPEIVADGSYSDMQTFDQHLVTLVRQGEVSMEVATASSSRPHDFSVMLKRAGGEPARPGEWVS